MSFFQETFNHQLFNHCAEPHDILRVLRREMTLQVDRVVDALKAKGEGWLNCLNFGKDDRSDFTVEWSVNLDIGVETMAVYRKGWSVPLVVIDRQLPWCGKENHVHMAEFVGHHFKKNGPAAFRRSAALAIAGMLNDLIIKWKKVDLVQIEQHSPALSLDNGNLDELQ